MEIARAVNLPYPTTMRIVQTLVQAGMIEREQDRKSYRPTALVVSLSNGYQGFSRLAELSRPHLVQLTEMHGWAAVFSTRLGQQMIVRECTHAISPFTLSIYHPGFAYPLWRSAGGLAYLAFLSREARAQARTTPPGATGDPGSPRFETPSDDLALDDIKRKGYAVTGRNHFTTPPGKNSAIAAPVFIGGRVEGAVSLIFMASAMTMARAESLYVKDVLATADSVSRSLSAEK
jgi:IclR family mhp operon transcriptional activator